MTKLNIEIKIDELAELDQVVGYIRTLDLNEVSEFNPEITVKFGHDDQCSFVTLMIEMFLLATVYASVGEQRYKSYEVLYL